jgi:Histidine kinase-, DNA gyrase B-, and HSP90-like ATPase
MQSSDFTPNQIHSVGISKLGTSQAVAAAFDDNQALPSFCASHFIVTRAGALPLTNAEGRREMRRIRLHAATSDVQVPHEKQLAGVCSLEELTSDLKGDIDEIHRSLGDIDEKLSNDGNTEGRQVVDQLRRRIQRLNQWTQSVIEANLVRQGKVQAFYRWANIFEWLSAEQTRWNQLARIANVNLDCSIHIDLISRIWTDTEIVQRILENLVANAIDVSEPNQKIQINAELSKDDEPWLIISVIDPSSSTIPNLTPDGLHPHFMNLGEGLCPLRGHGLGLAVCMQLARLLDGYLDFSSVADRGIRFDLHLPAGGIFAWLKRQDRNNPHASIATPLHVISIDSSSPSFSIDEKERIGQAIQLTLRSQAAVLQLDDESWVFKGNIVAINATDFLDKVKSHLTAIAPAISAKAQQLAFRYRTMGPMKHVMNCIETVIGRTKAELGLSTQKTDLAMDKPTNKFQDLPIAEPPQPAPVDAKSHRIDRTHSTRKSARIPFRSMVEGSNTADIHFGDLTVG